MNRVGIDSIIALITSDDMNTHTSSHELQLVVIVVVIVVVDVVWLDTVIIEHEKKQQLIRSIILST